MARALEKIQLIFGTPAADRGIAGRTSRLIRLAPTCDRNRRDCPPRRIDSPGRRREMSCHHRVRDAIGGWNLSVNGLGGLAARRHRLGDVVAGVGRRNRRWAMQQLPESTKKTQPETLATQTNQIKQRLLTASTERGFSHVTDLAYYGQFSWTWTGVHGSGTCGRSQRGSGSPQSGPTCRSAAQVRGEES